MNIILTILIIAVIIGGIMITDSYLVHTVVIGTALILVAFGAYTIVNNGIIPKKPMIQYVEKECEACMPCKVVECEPCKTETEIVYRTTTIKDEEKEKELQAELNKLKQTHKICEDDRANILQKNLDQEYFINKLDTDLNECLKRYPW